MCFGWPLYHFILWWAVAPSFCSAQASVYCVFVAGARASCRGGRSVGCASASRQTSLWFLIPSVSMLPWPRQLIIVIYWKSECLWHTSFFVCIFINLASSLLISCWLFTTMLCFAYCQGLCNGRGNCFKLRVLHHCHLTLYSSSLSWLFFFF